MRRSTGSIPPVSAPPPRITTRIIAPTLARAQEQLSWIPQHRPAQAVQADIDSLKDERTWAYTEQCSKVSGSKGRGFCQKYHALSAELASAQQSIALEARVADIQGKMTHVTGAAVMTEADPQAAVLAKLAAIIAPNIKIEDVQTALTVFIALLLEVGSGFGMYIAFSQWRLYESHAPTAPTYGAGQHRCGSGGGPYGRCDSKAAFRRERQQVCSAGPETDCSRKRRGALLQGEN